MSRDKERIPEVLDGLEEYWQEHPDLRLAQVVVNIGKERGYGNDPFYMPDAELLRILRQKNADE